MRDVVADGAAEDLNRGLEQDDGGGAVDIVVAVDEDRFARCDACWIRVTAAAMPCSA
jgi:hypothetical protein